MQLISLVAKKVKLAQILRNWLLNKKKMKIIICVQYVQ